METMHAAGRRRLPPVPRPAADRTAAGQLTVERPAQPDTALIDTRQIAADLIEAELAALTTAAGPGATEPADDDVVDEGADDEGADDAAADDAAAGAGAAHEAPAQDGTAQLGTAVDEAASDDTEKFQLALDAEESTTSETAGDAVLDPRAAGDEAAAAAVPVPRAELTADEALVLRDVDEPDPAQAFVARLRASAPLFAEAAGAESAVIREAVPPARHRRARCHLVLRFAEGGVADVTLLGPAGAPGPPSRHGFDRQILRWLSAGLVRDEAWLVPDPDALDGVAVDVSAWLAAG